MADFTIEEFGSDKHPLRESAERASIQALGFAIAQAVRAGLEDGRFVEIDGVVMLADCPTMWIVSTSVGVDHA